MSSKISDDIDPHSLSSKKLLAFWAIDQLNQAEKTRFSSGEIARFFVETVGINVSRQAIEYALKSDRDAAHKDKNGYKLMEPGKRQLRQLLPKRARVTLIEAGKPFTAKSNAIKEVFESLSGDICISDPYVDLKTLDLIFRHYQAGSSIKLLTQNVNDHPTGSFQRHLEELRREGIAIQVGVYQNSELHDRYLFDANNFWLSGNSLNGLGLKESFLVAIGEDIRQSVTAQFNRRWRIAEKC